MTAPVVFRWHGPDDRYFQGEGATRDVSVDSLFVMTPTCPPANALVHMEVILPLSGGAAKAHMKADMTVQRVDHDLAKVRELGFSAVGSGFSLSTRSKRASRAVADLIKTSEVTAGEMGTRGDRNCPKPQY
jgi:hypothetical protein